MINIMVTVDMPCMGYLVSNLGDESARVHDLSATHNQLLPT